MPARLSGLRNAPANYRGILCDVWGVLHNGVAVYEDAAEALQNYRHAGGHVVMITNSPRRSSGVLQQLDGLGVDRSTYDAVVTSGDVTRELISNVEGGIFHLGPGRDLPLFEGLDAQLVGEASCDAIVCTGLFHDESETPEDYTERLRDLANSGIPFICANPDIVVERGDRLIWCAGSLAQLYEKLGGTVRVAGKPHPPIYDLASRRLFEIAGGEIPRNDILAIGDGMPTDVAGAEAFGCHLLYISGGIHAGEYGGADNPVESQLLEFLEKSGAHPQHWMPKLIW